MRYYKDTAMTQPAKVGDPVAAVLPDGQGYSLGELRGVLQSNDVFQAVKEAFRTRLESFDYETPEGFDQEKCIKRYIDKVLLPAWQFGLQAAMQKMENML